MRAVTMSSTARSSAEDTPMRKIPEAQYPKHRKIGHNDGQSHPYPMRMAGRRGHAGGLFLLGWMRPNAPPHHSVGGSFDIGAGNRHHVGITRWPHLAVQISARQLNPRLALVDQLTDRLEPRIVQRIGLSEQAKMIEHDRG